MDFPLVIDFLWSDPKGANGYGPSTRVPMVYTFGPDVAQRFLQANNLKYMLRSHETKSAGYQERIHQEISRIDSKDPKKQTSTGGADFFQAL